MERTNGNSFQCRQVYGYKGKEKVHEEDIISVMKFDEEGKHLAFGDKAGRVILFKVPEKKTTEGKLSYLTEVDLFLNLVSSIHNLI